MNELAIRAAIVNEAMSWLRTPYHHQGFIKGAGVDCAFLLIKVYHAVGLLPDLDPRPYPPDWHLHRSEQRYLVQVENVAHRVEVPQPGDVALFQFGRCVSHGAIVNDDTTIIHAYIGEGVVLGNYRRNPLASRLHSFWSLL